MGWASEALAVLAATAPLLGVLIGWFFWLIGSKLLPPSDHALIGWMQADRYYCVLLPLAALPVSALARYLLWFTKSLFRHN
jgi:phosphatidylinositol glycan anchor class Y biosynthesis protein